jgi:predicted DNA-binding ribbon-helix-helix protein
VSGLLKRSFTLAGHRTSLALEPAFWAALDAAAISRRAPVAQLLAEIDAARGPDGGSLASAVRVWLLAEARGRVGAAGDDDADAV